MKELEYQWFSPEYSSFKKPKFILSSSYEKWSARVHVWQPPTDLYETDQEYSVEVEIAGMREAEFAISLEHRTLFIRGIRNIRNKAQAYYQMEISTGEFLTVVEIPGPYLYDQIEASYADGFLKVVLPKEIAKHVDIKSEM